MDANKSASPRRVYMPELMARTGWSDEWVRQKEKRGLIPKGRKDEGGKRKFWLDYEADAIVKGEAAA